MLDRYLSKLKLANRDVRLFRKIMNLMNPIPYPGDLKNMIRSAIAFSDPQDGQDYLRRLYSAAYGEKPGKSSASSVSEILLCEKLKS